MKERIGGRDAAVWMGHEAGTGEAFGGGRLWIGQHAVDQDILVFDPSESDPSADVLRLYSLTQHRMRSFPRTAVLQRIHVIADDLAYARAKKGYAGRELLRTTHELEVAAAHSRRMGRMREGVIAAHRRFLEGRGLAYEGVRETAPDHRPGRRNRCHACEIALDDFADTVCAVCNGVLCSCGACACGRS